MTAAKTISDIYNSLVMLTLTKELQTEDALLALNSLIQERIVYFQNRLDAKQLTEGNCEVIKEGQYCVVSVDAPLVVC